MSMTVGERRFAITLTDSDTARAFAAQLPLTLDMSDLDARGFQRSSSVAMP